MRVSQLVYIILSPVLSMYNFKRFSYTPYQSCAGLPNFFDARTSHLDIFLEFVVGVQPHLHTV